MTAYVIAYIEVTGNEGYQEYTKRAPVATAKFGGKAIIRGGKTVVLEGNDKPSRIVVLQFPSLENAKAWFDSPEYQEARKFRLGNADFRMIAVEGA